MGFIENINYLKVFIKNNIDYPQSLSDYDSSYFYIYNKNDVWHIVDYHHTRVDKKIEYFKILIIYNSKYKDDPIYEWMFSKDLNITQLRILFESQLNSDMNNLKIVNCDRFTWQLNNDTYFYTIWESQCERLKIMERQQKINKIKAVINKV